MSLRTTIAFDRGSLSRDICSFISLWRVRFFACIFTNLIIYYKDQPEQINDLGTQPIKSSSTVIYTAQCHNNFMRKLYKLLTIANLSIQLDEHNEAKDISRARLRIFQDGNNQRVHATKQYASIHENKLQWDETIQFRYTGQTRLTFQTDCEHQYGYDLQQLKVLFSGIYYLRNQMFFRQDSCHVYSPGQKKGLLKLQIKIQSKQEAPPIEAQPQASGPLIRDDLIGLIKINSVCLQITNSSFNKKRHQWMLLKLSLGTDEQVFEPVGGLMWPRLPVKFQYVNDGPQSIKMDLIEDEKVILEGSVECSTVKKQRRFTTLRVPMFNCNGIKVGSLIIQYRYLAKQQLLDLIYSPNNKLTSTGRSESIGSSVDFRPVQHIQASSSRRKSVLVTHSRPLLSPANRYKIGYLMSRNSDILIPKAARFQQLKCANSNISYIDPQKSSDFFSGRSKGPAMSKSSKFDFTRPFRSNPGVGQYKLPSIWSKY